MTAADPVILSKTASPPTSAFGQEPESLADPAHSADRDALIDQIARPSLAAVVPIPSLRSNFAWTFAGNMLYAGCQWGMISVLAKLGSPSITGQFTLGLAVSAPVFMFTNLQLRAVQATDVNADCGFADYFSLRLLATLLGLAAIISLLPFAGASRAVRLVVLLVSLSKCIECMSDVTAGLLQREEQLKLVAISLIIRGAASVFVFSMTFTWSHNLALSVAAMSGVWLAVLMFYDVPKARRWTTGHEMFFRFDRRALGRLAMLGLPLGWVATLTSLGVNTPRYFLEYYCGLEEQGIYSSLAYLFVVVSLVVVALTQSVTTRLARLFADGDRKEFVLLLSKLSLLGMLVAVAGVPLMLLFGRPLLTLLYRSEYAEHTGLAALLMGTAGLDTVGAFLSCGLTAARRFRAQVPSVIAATVIGGAGSAVLVPRYGLAGAGTGLLLSVLVQVLGSLWVLHHVVTAELQT